MCPTRIEIAAKPIELDLSDVFSFKHGFGRADFLAFATQAEEIRSQVTADLLLDSDTALPQRLLADYKTARRRSLLGQILGAAKRLRDAVDRVVILGSASSIEAAGMLFAACCHPFHNELSRGQRGGRPRIHLVPAVADNDFVHGLIEILPRVPAAAAEDRWGMIAIDDNSNGEMLVGLFHLFWDALQATTAAEDEPQQTVVVADDTSPIAALASGVGLPRLSCRRPNLKRGSEPFDPGVLLAASVMGMDIVKLLRGAAQMLEKFVQQPLGNNPVLDLAVISHLLNQRRKISQRLIQSAAAALQPLAAGFSTIGENVNRQTALVIQLLADSVRADRLRVTMPVGEKKVAEQFLTDLAAHKLNSARELRRSEGQPTAVIRMAAVDEFAVGQLIAMLSIAELVESMIAQANTPDS